MMFSLAGRTPRNGEYFGYEKARSRLKPAGVQTSVRIREAKHHHHFGKQCVTIHRESLGSSNWSSALPPSPAQGTVINRMKHESLQRFCDWQAFHSTRISQRANGVNRDRILRWR